MSTWDSLVGAINTAYTANDMSLSSLPQKKLGRPKAVDKPPSSQGFKPKRPVGRPRKHPLPVATPVKRPVGRPRKHPIPEQTIKRRPGRPRRLQTPEPRVKRRPGRPRKAPAPIEEEAPYSQTAISHNATISEPNERARLPNQLQASFTGNERSSHYIQRLEERLQKSQARLEQQRHLYASETDETAHGYNRTISFLQLHYSELDEKHKRLAEAHNVLLETTMKMANDVRQAEIQESIVSRELENAKCRLHLRDEAYEGLRDILSQKEEEIRGLKTVLGSTEATVCRLDQEVLTVRAALSTQSKNGNEGDAKVDEHAQAGLQSERYAEGMSMMQDLLEEQLDFLTHLYDHWMDPFDDDLVDPDTALKNENGKRPSSRTFVGSNDYDTGAHKKARYE
ncbi:hypothetical protein CYLTODRAFT_488435 [Cylindrobasidium torrendii FP15055 ss-10]|uniref:Uncharacterized protein n=1 Tax=Cylindrobasidium torrendii FP15055 ss-10 TaxID=1314674 RepID=A0A0D7BKC5_9AGAR|nr:hypothetical protein CYLTODRAFT_488435 [Cylindrobasidium torrendii FP15055 ss-10]